MLFCFALLFFWKQRRIEFLIPENQNEGSEWKKNEPECCVIIFEGAGHCVNMDTPDKFNAAMEEFWLSGYGKY